MAYSRGRIGRSKYHLLHHFHKDFPLLETTFFVFLGHTQTDCPVLDRAYFAHPIDIHLATKTMQGYLNLHLCMHSCIFTILT